MTADHTPPITQALGLAAQALFLSSPNPRVGCVITAPDGRVLGEGFTQQVGGPHAEVVALRAAQAAGHDVRGATAYVTLEPCAHQGRTGPCCDALIAAGIGKVVASLEDPNPLVAGQGFARLRAAGVAVEVGPGAAAATTPRRPTSPACRTTTARRRPSAAARGRRGRVRPIARRGPAS